VWGFVGWDSGLCVVFVVVPGGVSFSGTGVGQHTGRVRGRVVTTVEGWYTHTVLFGFALMCQVGTLSTVVVGGFGGGVTGGLWEDGVLGGVLWGGDCLLGYCGWMVHGGVVHGWGSRRCCGVRVLGGGLVL